RFYWYRLELGLRWLFLVCFFFSSRRRHTRWPRDWSSDVCSSDLPQVMLDLSSITCGPVFQNYEESVKRSEEGGSGSCWSLDPGRSEERRVGKECRSRWSP